MDCQKQAGCPAPSNGRWSEFTQAPGDPGFRSPARRFVGTA
jgi:hypothetical protein